MEIYIQDIGFYFFAFAIFAISVRFANSLFDLIRKFAG
jgi:hypothetical protein